MENYEIIKHDRRANSITVNSNCVYSYHTHMHTYCEMTLYEAFDGRIAVNDRDIAMDSMTCILVVPSDFHRITVNGTSSSKFIKIGFDCDCLSDMEQIDFSIVMQQIDTNSFFVSLFEEMRKNMDDVLYLRHLVNAAVCTLCKKGEKILSVSHNTGYRIASDAAKLIHEHFGEPITQADIAKRLSVSPQYLSKVFRRALQIGFSDYLIQTRLRRAAKRLIETDESVTKICFDCGFGNLSHFLRSFKAHYGASPTEYRKK